MDRLIGTGVALVTPFDEQQRIDRESLYRLVNYVCLLYTSDAADE